MPKKNSWLPQTLISLELRSCEREIDLFTVFEQAAAVSEQED